MKFYCSSVRVGRREEHKTRPYPWYLSAHVLGHFSHVQLFVIPWTTACQAPLSMGFSRQEYWIGLPCPPPGDLPDPGIELASLMSPTLSGGFFTTSATWEATKNIGVGSHSLLQGIFPTQGLNAGLLHCRQILYHLSHQRRIFERQYNNTVVKRALDSGTTGLPVSSVWLWQVIEHLCASVSLTLK